ncbi:MAG: hypothetical protein JO021_25315 [Alphaproteobacteria bacterium]|nr:hypothetical protein [Alphaproteobacteria bacterium]
MSYINSLSQTLFLQNAIKTQNQNLTTLQQIVASGGQKAQDFSGFTPTVGDFDLKTRGAMSRNSAYKDTISTLSTRTQQIENSLTSVDSGINNLANTITQLNVQDPTGAAVRQTAQDTLNQAVSQLNTTSDGVPLFSGVATNTTNAPSFPIASTTAIENMVTANLPAAVTTLNAMFAAQVPAIAPVTTTTFTGQTIPSTATGALAQYAGMTDAQAAVAIVFNNPANTSTWFVPGAAGVPAAPAQVADDQSIQASVTANPNIPANGTNPYGTAIKNTLESVVAAAVLTPSNFVNQADYNRFLVGQIGQINNASSNINTAVAVNGVVRGELGTAQTANDTSTNLLQQAIDTNEVQDVATSVTNLQNLQTQLQATYQVTAQLKGLSLANFL